MKAKSPGRRPGRDERVTGIARGWSVKQAGAGRPGAGSPPGPALIDPDLGYGQPRGSARWPCFPPGGRQVTKEPVVRASPEAA